MSDLLDMFVPCETGEMQSLSYQVCGDRLVPLPNDVCYPSPRVKPPLPRRTRLAIEREVRGEEFFSFQDLAERWHCSRGTVRNRLRALGAQVLDFSAAGQRGKKVVAASVVLGIESKRARRLC